MLNEILNVKPEKLSLTRNEKSILYLIYFISSITLFIIIRNFSPFHDGDTSTYIDAIQSYAGGYLDIVRTPVYPMFLAFSKLINFTGDFLVTACILQAVIYIISINYFFKLGDLFIKNRNVVLILTAVYAIHPSLTLYTKNVMSESLAINMMIFMVYNLVKFADTRKTSNLIYSLTFVLLELMMRPSMLFLLPVLFMYFAALKYLNNNKKAIYGVIGIIFISLLQIGYCSLFQKQYQIFSPSYISTLNKYYILKENNLIKYDELINKDLNVSIISDMTSYDETKIDFFDQFFDLNDKYALKEISDIIETSISDNKTDYILTIGKRFIKTLTERVGHWYYPSHNLKEKIVYTLFLKLPLTIGIIYILLAAFFISNLRRFINHKSLNINMIMIFLLICGNIAVIVIGAQSDWARLIVPVVPLIYILAGNYFFDINKK